MKKRSIMLLLALFTLALYAQSDNLELINKIKKSKSFLYGESTMPTRNEAATVAMDFLQESIQDWAKAHTKRKVAKIVATNVNSLVDSIVMQRLNMVRVFFYVHKSKLIPIFDKKGLVIVDPDAHTDSTIISEKKDTVEAAPKDTAKARTPDFLEGIDIDSTAIEAHNKDSVVIDIILDDSIAADTMTTPVEKNVALEKIKRMKSFVELRSTLQPLRQQGLITAYGKYATMTEPEESYLIIYDPNGRIRAILDKGSQTRKNLNTGKTDSIRNYRGCGAIWFQLSKK